MELKRRERRNRREKGGKKSYLCYLLFFIYISFLGCLCHFYYRSLYCIMLVSILHIAVPIFSVLCEYVWTAPEIKIALLTHSSKTNSRNLSFRQHFTSDQIAGWTMTACGIFPASLKYTSTVYHVTLSCIPLSTRTMLRQRYETQRATGIS